MAPPGQRRVPQPERRAAARRSSTGACASNVGFSAFVSIGSMLDVGWGDLIDYLGDDPHTQSIVIYMESIGDARSFLSAAREVALTKPIIVIKAGRTEAAAKAAASHTGALTGSDEVLDAAFRRVRRAARRHDLRGLLHGRGARQAAAPARPAAGDRHQRRRPRRAGHRRPDRRAAASSPSSRPRRSTRSTRSCPPPGATATRSTSWATPSRRATPGARGRRRRPDSDGLLVILTPQAMTDPTQTAEALAPVRPDRRASRCWRAGWAAPTSRAGEAILNRGRHPDLPLPRHRRPRLHAHVAVAYNLRGLYETPDAARRRRRPQPRRARRGDHRRARAPRAGRSSTEFESKQLLGAYGIPTVDDPRRRERGRGRRGGRSESAIPSSSSCTPRRSRTRPTSAACSSTCGDAAAVAPRLRGDRERRSREQAGAGTSSA